MAHRKIIDLRNLLAERFAHAPTPAASSQIATGIAALDHATNGGLPRGSITELTSPRPSAGSALLIHCLLELARRERFFLALIDGLDSFDVQSVGEESLLHLLWVRCQKTSEAIKAADFLLRDGNFPLVVLDLVLNPAAELRRVPATSWYRLQRLVEPAPTAFLVMSRHNLVASARTKIVLENQWRLPDLERDQVISDLRWSRRRSVALTTAFMAQ